MAWERERLFSLQDHQKLRCDFSNPRLMPVENSFLGTARGSRILQVFPGNRGAIGGFKDQCSPVQQ